MLFLTNIDSSRYEARTTSPQNLSVAKCVALSGKSMKGALEIPIETMSQKQDLQLDFNQISLKSITKRFINKLF